MLADIVCVLAKFGLTLAGSKVLKGVSSLATDFTVYVQCSLYVFQCFEVNLELQLPHECLACDVPVRFLSPALSSVVGAR